eukprot:scaffold428573_cov14-Prasinocladus_malaysianus.AAC.1
MTQLRSATLIANRYRTVWYRIPIRPGGVCTSSSDGSSLQSLFPSVHSLSGAAAGCLTGNRRT